MKVRVESISLHGRLTKHLEPESRYEVNQTVMNGIYFQLRNVLSNPCLKSQKVPEHAQEKFGLFELVDGLLPDRRDLFVLDGSFLVMNGHVFLPDGQLRNIVRVSSVDHDKSSMLIHTLREIEPERYPLWKDKSYEANIRCDCISEISQMSKHNNNAYKPHLSR